MCWISVCWILYNTLCSMSWVVSGFRLCPSLYLYLAPYVLLSSYHLKLYNGPILLKGEDNLSLCSRSKSLLSLNSFDSFMPFAFHGFQSWREKKHLLSEVSIHGYKVFHVDKPAPTGRGGESIMYVKNTLNPIERKSSATCAIKIIQVAINPKSAVHMKLV